MSRGEVEIAPIRRALAAKGITPTELARRLEWAKPDTQRARRTLGMTRHGNANRPRERMDYARALVILEAADLDPVDVGL